MEFIVEDSFTTKEGKYVSIFHINEDDVKKFSINTETSLVDNDGEGFNVKEFEFLNNNIRLGFKICVVVTERPIRKFKEVRLFQPCYHWWGIEGV